MNNDISLQISGTINSDIWIYAGNKGNVVGIVQYGGKNFFNFYIAGYGDFRLRNNNLPQKGDNFKYILVVHAG